MSHLAWRKTNDEPDHAGTDVSGGRLRQLLSPRRARLPRRKAEGIAFEIADLLLAQAWAAYHGVRLHIRLDHTAGQADYEEVLEFNIGRKTLSGLVAWRCAGGVLVRPTLGKKRRFDSVAWALEHLLPEPEVELTDIAPTGWPDAGR